MDQRFYRIDCNDKGFGSTNFYSLNGTVTKQAFDFDSHTTTYKT